MVKKKDQDQGIFKMKKKKPIDTLYRKEKKSKHKDEHPFLPVLIMQLWCLNDANGVNF